MCQAYITFFSGVSPTREKDLKMLWAHDLRQNKRNAITLIFCYATYIQKKVHAAYHQNQKVHAAYTFFGGPTYKKKAHAIHMQKKRAHDLCKKRTMNAPLFICFERATCPF